MIHCTEIPGTEALNFWPELKPYIVRALAYDIYNTLSLQHIKEQIHKGYARVLVCTDDDDQGQILMAAVLQLYQDTNDDRIVHVLCTAGENVNRWMDVYVAAVKDICAQEDCVAITLGGRPGWVKKLVKYGFRTDQIHMRWKSGIESSSRREEREPLKVVR